MLPWEVAPLWEGFVQVCEHGNRWKAYAAARQAADAAGKPLLNIGCPRMYGALKYPCGDVCLDVDLGRLGLCQSEAPTLGDVRRIPFPDRYFGAALCSHVLEHLPTVADGERALAELRRVADAVFVVSPSRASLAAWLHPGHRLWVEELADGTFVFEQRDGSGLGASAAANGILDLGIAGSLLYTAFAVARHLWPEGVSRLGSRLPRSLAPEQLLSNPRRRRLTRRVPNPAYLHVPVHNRRLTELSRVFHGVSDQVAVLGTDQMPPREVTVVGRLEGLAYKPDRRRSRRGGAVYEHIAGDRGEGEPASRKRGLVVTDGKKVWAVPAGSEMTFDPRLGSSGRRGFRR